MDFPDLNNQTLMLLNWTHIYHPTIGNRCKKPTKNQQLGNKKICNLLLKCSFRACQNNKVSKTIYDGNTTKGKSNKLAAWGCLQQAITVAKFKGMHDQNNRPVLINKLEKGLVLITVL